MNIKEMIIRLSLLKNGLELQVLEEKEKCKNNDYKLTVEDLIDAVEYAIKYIEKSERNKSKKEKEKTIQRKSRKIVKRRGVK